MSSRNEKIMNFIGLGLLLLCFGFALVKVFAREASAVDRDTIQISFAHWQLEGGLRETFDTIAHRYEQIQLEKAITESREALTGMAADDPERPALAKRLARMESGDLLPVRITQVPVPESVFQAWLKTRLVGKVAPHLITLKPWQEDTLIATYFQSLGREIEEVNPYNAGTPLEGIKWRDTFVDGLRQSGFRPNLMDYYSIPSTVLTIRMFYNADLLGKVLDEPANTELKARIGPVGFPENFRDFVDLCHAIRAYGEARDVFINPISGSNYNTLIFMNDLFFSQTQKKRIEDDVLGDHNYSDVLNALSYIRGEWNYNHPATYSALTLMREVGTTMKPGFLQMKREDAVFDFIQERAAMICTGAWDAPSLKIQAGDLFNIGVARTPVPTREEPGYGQHVLGPLTEAQEAPGVNFALTMHKPEREKAVAIDFLRYLTSFEGAKLFTDGSGWLPATIKVEPKPEYAVFAPNLEGYPQGYQYVLKLSDSTQRTMDNSMHQLLARDGSVDRYIEAVNEPMRDALLYALDRQQRGQEKILERQDVQIGLFELTQQTLPEEAADMRKRLLLMLDSQQAMEAQQHHMQHELDKLEN